MYKTMMHGVAIALLSAAMGFSGSAAAVPGGPSTSCSEANWGEIASVESYNPRTGHTQRIYECTQFGWSIIARCDDNGCIYY